MNHDVLDLVKAFLNGGVDGLGNGVAFPQGDIAVGRDLQIHIDPVAEDPGLDQIHSQHTGLGGGALADLLLHIRITGVIHHFYNGILENIVCGLEDEQADHQAGNGIQNGIALSGGGDADEGTYGGQRIAAVVPGIGHEGPGVQRLGIVPGVPVHGLFAGNGDNGGDHGQHPGNGDALGGAGGDFCQGTLADEQAGHRQNHRQHHCGHALEPLVTIGVAPVRILGRELHANDDDDAAEDIRCRMYRVTDHCTGIGSDTGQQL